MAKEDAQAKTGFAWNKKLPKAKEGFEWQPEKGRGRPEKELDYYDVPFSTDIELEDFSKEFLCKIARIWAKWYMGLALFYNQEVEARLGVKAASEIMLNVWLNLAKEQMHEYIPLLGPDYKTEDDLKTLQDCMKMSILPPDGIMNKGLFDGTLEWKDDKTCVTVCTTCALLESFEAMDKLEQLKWLCNVQEPAGSEAYMINPKIKITQLKLPPRKDPSEPCCIMEFKMTDEIQSRDPGRWVVK